MPTSKNSNVITVSRLRKRFGGLMAVDDLSFEVRAGELFGFLGPNGAGKTTTISILCTLLAPTAGSVSVAGFDSFRQPYAVRERIGIIFQEPSLDERLTAWENMLFHGMIYHMPKKKRLERMTALLGLVGLWERRHSIVKTFSGGMKRRLEVARGLMHEPSVLFLDEPTIGLDPQTRHSIWATLDGLRSWRQTTLFLTTHSMEEAQRCDRVAIIDQGRLLALDTPEVLMGRMKVPNLETVFLELTGHALRDEK